MEWSAELLELQEWTFTSIENSFKEKAAADNIKPGELQLPMRVMLVGGKFGPPVFDIAAVLGKQETIGRINAALSVF